MINKKEKNKELGPDNAEARHLMDVLHEVVDTSQHSRLEEDDTLLGAKVEFTNTGVGKDITKYSFADVEVDGKEYFVQVRDKKTYDQMYLGRTTRDIGPSLNGRSLKHSADKTLDKHYVKAN